MKHSLFVRPANPSLRSRFEELFAHRREDGFRHLGSRSVIVGCETRDDPKSYRLDGLRRGEDPANPRITFQATLSGHGVFQSGRRSWTVGHERAFFSVMPSRHVYFLPEDSPEWTFFWFHFSHPYVAQRLKALAEREPPVFDLQKGSNLLVKSLALFERICRADFDDAFEEEAALFDWMLTFEQQLVEATHSKGEREGLLQALRDYTLERLDRSFGIDAFARTAGLSRSHYCHRFKDATGLAPAAYVLEVRLGEARRLLRKSSAPLKEIAAATGFADANHLCKAFRRLFHTSPGSYRASLSGRVTSR